MVCLEYFNTKQNTSLDTFYHSSNKRQLNVEARVINSIFAKFSNYMKNGSQEI